MNARHLVAPGLLPALDACPNIEFSRQGLAATRETISGMPATAPLPEGLAVDVEERRMLPMSTAIR